MAFFAQVPAKVNIGSQIGQALGQGLQSGMTQGMQTQYQRGMLQNALGNVRNISQQGGKPLDMMLALMHAGAGIPGSEKYLATLLPTIMGTAQSQNLFGGEGGMTPQQQTAQALGVDPTTGQPISPQQQGPSAVTPIPGQQGIGLQPGQKPQQAGFLPPLQTPAQMQAFASKYAISRMDPSKYSEGLNIAQAQNEQAQATRENLTKEAIQSGKVLPQDAAVYRQIAEKYSNLTNPDEITTSATRDYKLYKNARDKLNAAFIPGIIGGAAEFTAKPFLWAMGKSGDYRDRALKKIQPTVKDLVNMGFEDEVRNKLATEHLSPTEIEETIFPFSDKQLSQINSFPEAKKIPEKARSDKLSNFFMNNITPETSLLALRQRLWDEKGYDWEEIGPSIRNAMAKGLKLTPQQSAEMTTVETDPPIQSLTSIFRDWGRWQQYLRGEK